MIAVVSDLHLQHTSLDVLRREEDGKVLETRITRNVGAGALGLLFAEIVDNAARSGAKRVDLVFAGDIFELHRTPLWFIGGERLRPTLPNAAQSAALEAKVLEIFDAIERDNRPFFDALRAFVQAGVSVHRGQACALPSVPVIAHYLPGNHDRLAQLWPSTRRQARYLLCLPTPDAGADAAFPHQLDWDRKLGYGVRIRHGHEYDSSNFSERFDPQRPSSQQAYEKPTLGDFVTVDIATRLAIGFRAYYARELRLAGAAGETHRRIYCALTEFDDVRPQSMLVRYLSDYLGANEAATFSLLRPVLRDVFQTAMADPFFVSEVRRLGYGAFVPFARLIEAALTGARSKDVARLVAATDRLTRDTTAGGPAKSAQHELGLATGEVSVIIAGHTHEPDHVALPGMGPIGNAGAEAYYLDTGTWRTRLDAGVGGAFGRLRAYTMVFCYHDEELQTPDARRFETWTGHLHAEDYGPSLTVDVGGNAGAPLQRVRFSACRVVSVDEGSTPNGAELVLSFGVDGAGTTFSAVGVKSGDRLVFPADTAVTVDARLDGELWCYGIEKDRGQSLLDPDDALPWGVTFLARTGGEVGAFSETQGQLRAADNRGNELLLEFEVS